jgi:hypothetical protein
MPHVGLVLLIVSPGLARGPARHRRTWSRWATKQTCTSPTVPPIIRYCQQLPTYRAVMTLNGNICNFAFAPSQNGKQRLIAPINILAEFQVASVI